MTTSEPEHPNETTRNLWEDEDWRELTTTSVPDRAAAIVGQCCRWTINGFMEGVVQSAHSTGVEWRMNDGSKKSSPWHLLEFLFRVDVTGKYSPVLASDESAPHPTLVPPRRNPAHPPTPTHSRPQNNRPQNNRPQNFPVHKLLQDRLRVIDEEASGRLGDICLMQEIIGRLEKLAARRAGERARLDLERRQIVDFLDRHSIPVLKDSSSELPRSRTKEYLSASNLPHLIRELYEVIDTGVLTSIPLPPERK